MFRAQLGFWCVREPRSKLQQLTSADSLCDLANPNLPKEGPCGYHMTLIARCLDFLGLGLLSSPVNWLAGLTGLESQAFCACSHVAPFGVVYYVLG